MTQSLTSSKKRALVTMRLPGLIIAVCVGGLGFTSVVVADPPWMRDYDDNDHGHHHKQRHKHHKKHHRHNDEVEVRYVYVRESGPPPWAPAPGYRRESYYQPAAPVVVEVPVSREPQYRDQYREEYRDQPQGEVSFNATSEKIGITQGTCNRESVGTVMGGVIGGIIGNKTSSRKNKTVSTLAGTVFGALIGKEIGRNMDNADAGCSNQVLERASDGQAVNWKNPDTNNSYSMTPYKSYQQDDGRYCRRYRTTVREGAREKTYDETACRNDQGMWETLK